MQNTLIGGNWEYAILGIQIVCQFPSCWLKDQSVGVYPGLGGDVTPQPHMLNPMELSA